MTLTQRATWTIVSLVAGLGVLSGAMLWGLGGLRQEIRVTFDEYRELRMIDDTDLLVAAAEALLASEAADYEAVTDRLEAALRELDDFLAFQEHEAHHRTTPRHEELEIRRALLAKAALSAVLTQVDELRSKETRPADNARIIAAMGKVLENLDHLDKVLDTAASSARDAANVRFRSTIAVVALLCLGIILVTLLISIAQYRSVVRPVRLLREGVREVSSGKFSEQIAAVGDGEFAELTAEFNRMRAELDGFYRTLESRVAEKSRELVRSERLASVGFLAAGLAHEINNPLNIISAYAELALKQLRKRPADALADDTEQALQIVRDESFRCKDIIEKLLTLTRPAGGSPQRVSLAHTADEVVSMVSRLDQYRGSRVTLQLDRSERLTVQGNEAELKQVLLNLTINALEAVKPGVGRVCIEGNWRDKWVELRVTDDGRGMTAETLEHVFEPFFTNHGDGRRGVGLGLSITHAIIESHGGRITAESDGPGRGSRFIIRLPAAAESARP